MPDVAQIPLDTFTDYRHDWYVDKRNCLDKISTSTHAQCYCLGNQIVFITRVARTSPYIILTDMMSCDCGIHYWAYLLNDTPLVC